QIGEGTDLRDIADRIEEIAETHCAAKPYLKVYGNDVRAGATFQPCHTGAPTAHIRTFARDITPTNLLWMGASVQHAVSATGNVEQFFSAGRRASLTNPTTPRPPNDLTFGNFNPPR